jgi:hypothetical protein
MRQAEGSRRARQPSQAISAISGGIYRKGNTAKSQIAKAANNPSASRPSEIFGISPQAIKSPPTLRLQVPSPQGRLGRTSRKTLCRRLIFLIRTASHDPEPSSGNGLCSALASSQGARIQTSRSSSVVRITGMALGWIGSTMAFGAVVKNP